MKLDPDKIWIMQVPVISTGHIQATTNTWLGEMEGTADSPLEIWDLDQGWMVYTPELDDIDNERYTTVPSDLKTCMHWCRENGCDWLRLDADGSDIDTLPTYDW